MKTARLFARVYYVTVQTAPVSAVAGFIAWLAQGLMPAVQAKLLEKLFDSAYGLLSGNTAVSEVRWYCLLFLALYGVVKLLEFSLSITVNAGIYEKCNSFHKAKIAQKTASLPPICLEDSRVLDLGKKSKTTVDRESLSSIFMSSALVIINSISLFSLTFVLGSYHPALIPVSLLSAVPFFFAAALRGWKFYNLKQGQAKKSRLLEYLWPLFSDRQAAREMKVMNFGDYLTKRWQDTRDEVNEELWAQEKKDAMSLLICEALKIGAYIASILFTLILTIRGEISIGMFGACIAGFKAVQDASKELLLRLGRLPELTGFAKDYFGYLDLEEHTVRGTKTIGSIETLTAEGIRFTYPNAGEPALKDVSLSIRKGEKVLILGENGSGKTTLTRLLLGMYPPAGGIIRYNGIPLDEIDKTSLYKKTAIVAQNFVQYKLTIRENIGISDIGRLSDDERLREALRLGGGGDILETADSNLDFRLGREFGGGELSGGQWQKLAISRSIFKDGEFFLLDEPTAALDPLIEWDILSGFMKITEGKTAVIISHRTGLCRLADTIIVMKAGRIVETGSHPVLLEQNGEYARLYNSQAIWYR